VADGILTGHLAAAGSPVRIDDPFRGVTAGLDDHDVHVHRRSEREGQDLAVTIDLRYGDGDRPLRELLTLGETPAGFDLYDLGVAARTIWVAIVGLCDDVVRFLLAEGLAAAGGFLLGRGLRGNVRRYIGWNLSRHVGRRDLGRRDIGRRNLGRELRWNIGRRW